MNLKILQKKKKKKRYGETGNKKRATCHATLLQSELNRDVAQFTNLVQTC